MLGNVRAVPAKLETGAGATRRVVLDNTPLFSRVHGDWRHDGFEDELRRTGALIEPKEDV